MSNVNHVVNNLTIAGAEPALSMGSQTAMRASYAPAGPPAPMATRASYQSNGLNPPPMYRQPMNQASMGQRRPMPMNQMPMSINQMRPPRRSNTPIPMGGMPVRQAMAQQPMGPVQARCNCGPGGMGGGMGGGSYDGYGGGAMGGPPAAMGYVPGGQSGAVNYDNAQMPGYAWPSYASYPNYAALSYPQQYSPSAWPYIGPFYPYPQVPLGWRKVCLEWDDGWWFLDFSDCGANH
jgi:hypothetical protein